jgi:DNA helicase-2/ATP-dependent DNA helicase PcrA
MENEESDAENKVSLMTMHSAKGLEFKVVFLPGWEEGLFPHQRAMDEGGLSALEEERRLAYVALTRAKERAVITCAARRRMYHGWTDQIPSRFIEELPEDNIQRQPMSGMHTAQPGAQSGYGHYPSYQPRGWTNQGGGNRWSSSRTPAIEGRAATLSEGGKFDVGDRVFHQKFGYGNVVYTEGNKLEIEFDKAGRKRLMDAFVEEA